MAAPGERRVFGLSCQTACEGEPPNNHPATGDWKGDKFRLRRALVRPLAWRIALMAGGKRSAVTFIQGPPAEGMNAAGQDGGDGRVPLAG